MRRRRGEVKALPDLSATPPATRLRRRSPWGGKAMFLDVLFFLAGAVLDLVWWAVILAVIVQLLINFNVLDTRNRFVWTIADFLYRVTEPMFDRVRRFLPRFGAIDLSPLVVLLLITAAEMLLGALRNYVLINGLYF